MDIFLDDDALLTPRRIHDWYLSNGASHSTDDKWQIGQVPTLSKLGNPCKVCFKKRGDMRRCVPTVDHEFGDRLAHLREGNNLFYHCLLNRNCCCFELPYYFGYYIIVVC